MVIVKAESIKESNHQISFQLFAKGLRNKVPVCGGLMWFNGRTQWAIERQAAGINETIYSQVYASEIKHGQNLKFRKSKLQLQQICNSDDTLPIRFVILVDGKGVSYA